MRVAVVFGTRPEVIKLAPVISELRRRGAEVKVISTSQHRELLRLALEVFDMRPDVDLDVMLPDQSLFDVTVRALRGLQEALSELSPSCVLAQGDTTTVLAVAMASFYLRIPFGHVEAGLRTHDIWSPYPEEANRQMVARITTWHFAPTRLAKENLLREGVQGRIYVTGNTVVDALESLKPKLSELEPPEGLCDLEDRGFVLVEVHRRESFGEPMREVLRAVRELTRYVKVVFPVHPNPNVREAVRDVFGVEPPYSSGDLLLIEPVDYLTMLWLVSKARVIVTDSGGLQEEAPSFGTPVVVTRPFTERPEGVERGFLYVVGLERQRVIETALRLIDEVDHEELIRRGNPYGDGRASSRIADVILSGEPLDEFTS